MTAPVSQVLSEAADPYSVVGEMLEYFEHYQLATWAPLASIIRRERAASEQPYLVWSNEHQAWWGPEHRGYTRHIERAGRYDRAEAMSIAGTRDGGWHVRKGNPDEIAIPERDAVEQYADIAAALAKEQGL